jgi:hypothetical protein
MQVNITHTPRFSWAPTLKKAFTQFLVIALQQSDIEGILNLNNRFAEFYKKYVRPHEYEFDEEFMKYGIVPAIFGAFGELRNVMNLMNVQINVSC